MRTFKVRFLSLCKRSKYYFKPTTIVVKVIDSKQAVQKVDSEVDYLHGLYIESVEEVFDV